MLLKDWAPLFGPWHIGKSAKPDSVFVMQVNLKKSCYVQVPEGSFQYHKYSLIVSCAQIRQKTRAGHSFITVLYLVTLL